MSIIHLLENNIYFTLFICLILSSFLRFCYKTNPNKRRECETGYIIAMVPIAAPAAKTSTNVSSGGVPRLLLVCVVVFMVA